MIGKLHSVSLPRLWLEHLSAYLSRDLAGFPKLRTLALVELSVLEY
jgi:hypothetical protein